MTEILYCEKYRPQTVDDCILPDKIKSMFKEFVTNKQIPNLLLSGGPGIGKTTIAKALCNDLDMEFYFLNASENGDIDTLRTKLKSFAGTKSMFGKQKVIILDEADYMTQFAQPALRAFIEEYSSNCRFILTCNFKDKIIAPLHSRMTCVDFTISKKERPKLMAEFFARILHILEQEEVTVESKDIIAELIKKHFPDFRRVLNELQGYGKTIDVGILTLFKDEALASVVKTVKAKNFKDMRQWVVDNIDNDPLLIYRAFYDNMYEYVDENSIAEFVMIIHSYMRDHTIVADKEINLVAFFTECMATLSFK